MRRISFKMEPLAPFRLDLTVWALRRRAHNLVDRWDGRTYRRVLALEVTPVEVAVTQTGPPERPEILVNVHGAPPATETEKALRATLTRVLGLEVDLGGFYRFAEGDPRLASLSGRFRGLKPPRFPTLFEALVNAFACQQLSLSLGIHLLNRLAAVCGARFPGTHSRNLKSIPPHPSPLPPLAGGEGEEGGLPEFSQREFDRRFRQIFGVAPSSQDHPESSKRQKAKSPLLPLDLSLALSVGFPRPQDAAPLTPENFRALGYSRSKGAFIIELARGLVEKTIDLEALASLDDEAATNRLKEIKGVGRWSAEYVLLRGLGRRHLFPGDDVGARQKLARWLHHIGPLNYEGVRKLLGSWQPYGGLIYFHLLLDGLAKEGYLQEVGGEG
jgi:3-methyladenine DNA glycosylase/8-oxoguanine DNA glycosylase